jgi:protein-disulfide isomerase
MTRITGIAIAILLATVGPTSAQTITSQQADEILMELRQIRQLLERMAPQRMPPQAPAPPERVTLPAVSGYVMGRPDAPLTLVEFTDLQCPYCRQFHAAAFEPLKRAWIDTGKLRFVSRDFPLDFHPQAMAAALASRCGGEQGKFWELRRALVLNADKLSPESIQGHARDLGLDMDRFRTCAVAEPSRVAVQKDQQEGQAAGISGTPSFVLGRTTNGPFEGLRVVGAVPFATLDQRIRELLETPAQR